MKAAILRKAVILWLMIGVWCCVVNNTSRRAKPDTDEEFSPIIHLEPHGNEENVTALQSNGENVTAFFGRITNVIELLKVIRLSCHLDSAIGCNWSDHLNYPLVQDPIGCLDMDTQQDSGVKAYSLMLLLRNPDLEGHEQHHIYITDVKSDHKILLPPKIQKEAVSLEYESIVCYKLIEMFGSAKLVITENLQHALSCAAMETPVIFISTKPEVAGVLTSIVYTVDMHRMNWTKAKTWFQNFSWEIIPHNPNQAVLMGLRTTSWNIIRQNQYLYDTATRLGVVPMSPPRSLQYETKLRFFLVFSTSSQISLKISRTKRKQSGQFNWRHWRSIESIFYHHPTAQVKVYSNTLPLNTFDVLTEAGYSIQVQRYHLEELLKGTPARGFIEKLTEARKGPHWYSNVSDLLRLLVLYRWGGIYMDTDVIVLRPLHSLKTNVLGWEEKDKPVMNGAFAKFENGNLFLEACLEEFARSYNGKKWGDNGPKLLTKVYRASRWSSDVISLVDYRQFYMIQNDLGML